MRCCTDKYPMICLTVSVVSLSEDCQCNKEYGFISNSKSAIVSILTMYTRAEGPVRPVLFAEEIN